MSLIPAGIVLAQIDPAGAETWLRKAVVWLADRYQGDALGLALSDAEPATELAYLLSGRGASTLMQRSQSFLAVVLLDLISASSLSSTTTPATICFLSTRAPSCCVSDDPGQFRYDGENIELESALPYAGDWLPTNGWITAPHHEAIAPRWLERTGRSWLALACVAVLRDHYDIWLIRRPLGNGAPPTEGGEARRRS